MGGMAQPARRRRAITPRAAAGARRWRQLAACYAECAHPLAPLQVDRGGWAKPGRASNTRRASLCLRGHQGAGFADRLGVVRIAARFRPLRVRAVRQRGGTPSAPATTNRASATWWRSLSSWPSPGAVLTPQSTHIPIACPPTPAAPSPAHRHPLHASADVHLLPMAAAPPATVRGALRAERRADDLHGQERLAARAVPAGARCPSLPGHSSSSVTGTPRARARRVSTASVGL